MGTAVMRAIGDLGRGMRGMGRGVTGLALGGEASEG